MIITCVWCYTVFEWMSLVGFVVWMYYLKSWWVYAMEFYLPCMMWLWVICWQYDILICCMLRVFCLAWKLLVEFNEDFRWMWCYVSLVWLFGFGVCVFKPRMNCDNKVFMLIECDVACYWTGFIYKCLLWISLFMVSLPLFVSLCVCCMCNDRMKTMFLYLFL